jgi:mycoredoxin
MPVLELFGAASCPHTREMREWLEFRGSDFLEYDVELDRTAFQRMRELTGGQRLVPVLIEDGKVVQSGWQGRGCVVGEDPHA